MPHGTADWNVTAGQQTVFRLTDLAEHAVRLGSVNSFERAGDVIAIEDFEAGFVGVSTVVGGSGALVDLHTGRTRSGLFAARLVAGSNGSHLAAVAKDTPIIDLSAFGFEASFSLPGSVEYVRLEISLYTGAVIQQYQVRWDDANNRIEYRNSAAAWVTLATGVSLSTVGKLFHTAKLVISATEGEYVRLRLGDATYSMSGIAGSSAADATLPFMETGVILDGRPGNNDTLYVDDLIVTQNEPV